MIRPKTYKPGERLLASDLNEEREELVRLGSVRAGEGLAARMGEGGLQVTDLRPRRFWIKLTSVASGAKYAWKEVVAATGGTWSDEGTTGSTTVDPAYEVNGRTTLTADGAVYEAWRGQTTDEVLFRC